MKRTNLLLYPYSLIKAAARTAAKVVVWAWMDEDARSVLAFILVMWAAGYLLLPSTGCK